MRVTITVKGPEAEAWVKVGEEVRHLPIVGVASVVFDHLGEVSVAVVRGDHILSDTRSKLYDWAEIIRQNARKEVPKAPPAPLEESPAEPLSTPPVEVIALEEEAPPKPLSIEERMAGWPEAKALNQALPGARFVEIREEGSEYVLGVWPREEGALVGYGVKGEKDRPLDGGQPVSTQEGDYWIVWKVG